MPPEVIASLIGIIPAILTFILVYKNSRKLETVHKLVNSQMGIQLALNAANSRWRADMSKKKADIKAANEAEDLLREHERKQAKVDAGT